MPLPKGSAGIRSYQMAIKLIEKGHKVTMVCGSASGAQTGLDSDFVLGKRKGIVDGINVIEYDLAYSNNDGFLKRSLLFFNFALRSSAIAMTHKYDVVFASTTPLTVGIPGILARWLRRKPFVFEVRDLWPELPKAMGVIKNPFVLKLMSLLEYVSYRSADRCIGLSPGIVEGIKARGVDESKITMVPNGCDLSIFSQPSELWRPKGVKDNDLMAIFTGTHGMANGLNAVLETAVELRKRGRGDIKLVLVGQGKLKPELEKRAAQLALDNVVFHPPVNKRKLSGLMASADLGMQVLANVPAFYYGTSPNKFFDYISAGLPVINNYPGWLAEMIEQTQCGFSVQPEDSKAFADALENAADQREALTKMGVNARQLAESQFDRSLLADKWVEWVTNVNATDAHESKLTSSEVNDEKTV